MTPRYSLLLKSLDSIKFFFGKRSRAENRNIERQLMLLPPCTSEELLAVNDNYQDEKQGLIIDIFSIVAYVLIIFICIFISEALPVESILKFILLILSIFLSKQTLRSLAAIIVSRKMTSIMHHFLLIHNL
ncbi:hypothetical protein [Chamaesiphon sp.]|uniref:hypothetical protein n=1 Tax=Chamaesiphon sp. TaxID=2814140 RepID=UPI003594643E